jgi:hypothetical protein
MTVGVPEAVRTPYQRSGLTRFTLWTRRLGWRHLVMWVVVAFAVFPVLFVVSAALNPVGTLSSAQLWPTGASLAKQASSPSSALSGSSTAPPRNPPRGVAAPNAKSEARN